MVYHLIAWWVAPLSAHSVMGRVGVYGVAIFYILSGLTMYHVYGRRMTTSGDAGKFFVRRAFRIFPLLWLVTIAALILIPQKAEWGDLVLNFTGLFGFVSWDTYFSPGLWSIGNELVFYALFPVLVALARTSRSAFVASGMILGGGYLYFAFVKLSPTKTIGEQWVDYINPGNQAFLFFIGIAIAYIGHRVRMSQDTAWATLGISAVLFVAWPVGVNSITDGTRLMFTLICAAICAAAYHLDFEVPKAAHKSLAMLGETSYSIYLLHPIVNELLKLTPLKGAPVPVIIAAVAACTFVAAWATYRWMEKPLIGVGRSLTSRKRPTPAEVTSP